MMTEINFLKNTIRLAENNHYFINLVDPLTSPRLFSDIEAIAAVACAEIQTHTKLQPILFESALTQSLHECLFHNEWCAKNSESIEELVNQLLPKVKNTLHNIYAYCKDNGTKFDEIIKTTQQECDYEFLQFITKIFIKAYLREIHHF